MLFSIVIDALEGNNDRREFGSAINSILRVLHREMDEGESGRWFTLDGFNRLSFYYEDNML